MIDISEKGASFLTDSLKAYEGSKFYAAGRFILPDELPELEEEQRRSSYGGGGGGGGGCELSTYHTYTHTHTHKNLKPLIEEVGGAVYLTLTYSEIACFPFVQTAARLGTTGVGGAEAAIVRVEVRRCRPSCPPWPLPCLSLPCLTAALSY